jgi:hypothetical protein
MFGVTPQGYVRKTYEDWLNDLQSKARTVDYFGPDQDLSDADPIGVAVKIKAYAYDEIDQVLEDLYYALYPDTAEGVSLDRVMKIGGEVRRGQQEATVPLRFTGAPGSVIPADSICSTAQGLQFKTLSSGEIAVDTIDIPGQCLTSGKAGIVPAGSITTLVNPIPGVTSVTNPEPSRGGRDQATDVEAKYDYKNKKTGSGAAIASILRSLYALKGVNFAFVFPNERETVDEEGRPPHSSEVVIDGGDSAEIAEVLFRHYVGLQYFGSVEKVVYAENGQAFTMAWNNPVNKDIFIDIAITTNLNWRPANIVLIKSAVIQFIGGLDTIAQGDTTIYNEYPGIGSGHDIHSHEIERVIDVPGVVDVVVSVSFTSPVVAGNRYLDLLARERPYTDNEKVTINVV